MPGARSGRPAQFGPESVLAALACAATGEVISLNRYLDEALEIYGRSPFRRTVRVSNGLRAMGDGRFAVVNDDEVSFALQGTSHWDALGHFGVLQPGETSIFHGGIGLEDTTPPGVAASVGIDAFGAAIISRGVLIDLVEAHGELPEGYLPGASRVGRDAIERWLDGHGAELRPGDVVVLYTGFERRVAALGGKLPADAGGIDATTVPLWIDCEVQALASDNYAVEATPVDYSLHVGLLRDEGVPLGELWSLEELATACRADGRYDFTLLSVPLAIRGAYGSPANVVAVRLPAGAARGAGAGVIGPAPALARRGAPRHKRENARDLG